MDVRSEPVTRGRKEPARAVSLTRLPDIDILTILRRHMQFILLTIVVVVSLTGLYLSRQAPVYSAASALVLEAPDRPSETEATAKLPGNVSPTTVFTEVEVMRSREFSAGLAERLNLFEDPRFNPAMRADNPPGLVERLRDLVGLPQGEDPRSLPEPEQRNRVISALQRSYSVSGSPQHNVIDIVARHSDPVLAARIANEVAALYVARTLQKETGSLARRISFLSERSEKLASTLSRKQIEMANLIQEKGLKDEDATELLLAELTPLENRLQSLPPDSPQRSEIENRIARLEQTLSERVNAELELAEQELTIQTDMTRYDTVNQRLSELEAQRDAAEANARLISEADVPREPIGPNVTSTLALAIIIGGVIGSVIAVLREALDQSVRSQQQAESATGLDVLASLPKLPKHVLGGHAMPHKCVEANAFAPFSQPIRSLVTSVYSNAVPGSGRFVFIGSGLPGEGKSSITASMAVAAAMEDLRVLVIDFDVHRGGTTQAFACRKGEHAVGDVLADSRVLADAIQETSYSGIDLLNFKPSSRFSRRTMKESRIKAQLDLLRETYDLILMDTAPFLVSEDSNRLELIADDALLISRWGISDRATLARTAERMQRSGFNVIGLAINGINLRKAEMYGYLDYTSYQYYAAEDKPKSRRPAMSADLKRAG